MKISGNKREPSSSPSDSESEDNIPLAALRKKYSETTDEEDNIPLSALKTGKQSEPAKKKRMVFVSKTVGLVKRKRKRTFKCEKCDNRYASQGELNTHYRANHARVKCPHCELTFTTPGSLSRHKYSHEVATK